MGLRSKNAIRTTLGVRLGWVLTLALGTALAFPAFAMAAQTFAVSAANGGAPTFQAGSNPSYTETVGLDTSAGGPTFETITGTPGVLASLAAAPDCLKMTPPANETSACQIGTGSATLTVGVPLSITAYLGAPPSATDVAGIDLVTNAPGNPTTQAAVDLVQTPSGNVQSVINADLSSLGTTGQFISSISTTIDGTLANGKPFTRMPTNCSPGPSSVTVTYANGSKETTNASPDFHITGCSALPYAPVLSASVVKDPHDAGVSVVTTVTQAANEAAGAGQVLTLPWPALAPNLNSLSLQNTSVVVGSAVATSPLTPAPLTGQAYLTGSGPFAPTLTLRFPAPNKLTLTGTVNLSNHSVTFSGLPDVPQTSLVVTLFGGPKALQSASCAPPGGTAIGAFTGQNGATVVDRVPLTVSGCPSAPSISRTSLSGLASGKPVLRFKLARGSDAPNLKSFVVALPGGLAFNAKKLGKGISITAAHSVRLSGGNLTVTLKRAVANVSATIRGPALVESKQLRRQSRTHSARRKTVQITLSDADGSSSGFVVSS
ncbi:MAG TPA: hypothetical protein VMP89_04510 [Solirubrobacteraceae bacterium]|nr:hypothetical protein [Solirubrobacteraceae bacterium]